MTMSDVVIVHDSASPIEPAIAMCGCGEAIYWDVDLQYWLHLPADYYDVTCKAFRRLEHGKIQCDHRWRRDDGR